MSAGAWAGRAITRCSAVEAQDGALVRVVLGIEGLGHEALGADPAARHGHATSGWKVHTTPPQAPSVEVLDPGSSTSTLGATRPGPDARTVLDVLRRGLVLTVAADLKGDDGRPRGVVLGTAAGTVVLVRRAGRLDVLAVQDAAPRAIVRAA